MTYHLCLVLFLRGGIFDKTSTLFVTLSQWVPSMSRGFSHFDQAPVLDILGYVT